MLQRIEVLLTLAAVVAVAIVLVRAWNARRVRRLLEASGASLWNSLGESPDGRRTLVAFSTPSCAACRKAQAPTVAAVEQRLGASEVRVIRVDAAQRPEVARAFGVLTVPSTVVLGAAGRVVAINQGFAPGDRLLEQLQHA
jgi:thioredoxin-like negative regulator of GroEL